MAECTTTSKVQVRIGAFFALALAAAPAFAQSNSSTFSSAYDDYGAFVTDPVDIEQEYEQIFGRFFQTSFLFGAGIYTREMGAAYSSGVNVGMRFVFYFDKVWASELSFGYAHHQGLYDPSNVDVDEVSLQLSQNLFPIAFGIRYAFDRDNLPRGLAAMNPYVAVNGQIVFRTEKVTGTPIVGPELESKYIAGDTIRDTAFGVNLGGGFEFDVYRKRLYLGLDLRYNLLFFGDRGTLITGPSSPQGLGRGGDYVTIQGTLSYSY